LQPVRAYKGSGPTYISRIFWKLLSFDKGRPRLKKALADAYSPFFGRTLDPDTEVTITTGANEGMLSAFMAFIEPGHEVILFEPFFDQYFELSQETP
jgi:kynurenine aminotransferase